MNRLSSPRHRYIVLPPLTVRPQQDPLDKIDSHLKN